MVVCNNANPCRFGVQLVCVCCKDNLLSGLPATLLASRPAPQSLSQQLVEPPNSASQFRRRVPCQPSLWLDCLCRCETVGIRTTTSVSPGNCAIVCTLPHAYFDRIRLTTTQPLQMRSFTHFFECRCLVLLSGTNRSFIRRR